MTANSAPPDDDLYVLKGRDLEKFGFARVRDLAYDAVQELWRRRKTEGWNQVRLAANIDRDTGWLSRYLQGPGNWTFRTFGALVEGLEGVVEIRVRAAEDVSRSTRNRGAYSDYVLDVGRRPPAPSSSPKALDLFGQRKSKAEATTELRP
jgi:hypothetical protein